MDNITVLCGSDTMRKRKTDGRYVCIVCKEVMSKHYEEILRVWTPQFYAELQKREVIDG
jgi:hypothetical protein